MAEQPLISVVVPVYGAEAVLSRCIDSILAQTYPNLELILVDDGSPDGSGAICDAYGRDHSRVRVLHQENAGVAKARAVGIANAGGALLGFVDSDDWIDPDMYTVLSENLLRYDADIAQCMYWEYDAQGRPVCFSEQAPRVCDTEECLRELLIGDVSWMSMCMKLYRRALFSGVPLENGMRCGEDSMVNYYLLKKADGVVVQGVSQYHYCHRPDSALRGAYQPWLFEDAKRFVDTVLQEEQGNDALRCCCQWRYLMLLYNTINRTIGDTAHRDTYQQARRDLLQRRDQLIHSPFSARKYRTGALLLQYAPTVYRALLQARGTIRARRIKRRSLS